MLGIIDAKPKVGYFPGKAFVEENAAASRLSSFKVKDIMGRPAAVRENDSVGDAVIQLFVENTGLLVVVDDAGNLAGVASAKDLLKVAMGNPNAAAMPVSMVMTRLPRVVCIGPEDSVLEAARRIIEHQVGGLPVVRDRAGAEGESGREVIGRITKTHILQVLIEQTGTA